MIPDSETSQRIARLTPLSEVLARIDKLAPVPPREADIGSAVGRVLAADVTAIADAPTTATAARDGFAVSAERIQDASSYAPVVLDASPPRLDAGEPLPAGCDAVLPLDALSTAQARVEILSPAIPGEGVWPAGADVKAAQPLRRAGQKLRASDLAIFAMLGIPGVTIREPRIWLAHAGLNPRTMPSMALIAAHLEREGADVFSDEDLEAALRDDSADAVIGIAGTGNGSSDTAVTTLRRHGRVECHGIGLMPGETAAFGFAGEKPVLLLPGALDGALAGWLMLGKRLLGRLAGRTDEEPAFTATLLRKVTSTIGIADMVPVRRNGDAVEPLASGTLPLSALSRADGWILVPADSEGYPAGASVSVRLL